MKLVLLPPTKSRHPTVGEVAAGDTFVSSLGGTYLKLGNEYSRLKPTEGYCIVASLPDGEAMQLPGNEHVRLINLAAVEQL